MVGIVKTNLFRHLLHGDLNVIPEQNSGLGHFEAG